MDPVFPRGKECAWKMYVFVSGLLTLQSFCLFVKMWEVLPRTPHPPTPALSHPYLPMNCDVYEISQR